MYHNFLTYSSLNGHLGCFHVLAIVNSAALNTEVDESFSIMVSSGYIPSRTTQFDFNIPCPFFHLLLFTATPGRSFP